MTGFNAADLRQMLARLRDIMAGLGSVQERLDKVVTLIAQSLRADVCSCYVMRAGEVLELFATYGLAQKAVHLTRLRVGEGLVGEIAAHNQSIALADAWSHPAFVYRPETGEDFFRSLMGVPMLQAGRVIGVLVVQTKEQRPFNDWEVETLETAAMVIAELMAAAQVVKREELYPAEGNALLPARMAGIALNPGIGIGTAVMHKPDVRIGRLLSDDPAAEHARLDAALAALRAEVDRLIDSAGDDDTGFGDILQVYRMFADDRGWQSRIGEALETGLTAEAAVQKVKDDTRVRMQQVPDPILRERLQDLDDLANRLLGKLTGASVRPALPENAILICRSIGPAELLDYDRKRIKGVIMEEGSPTMHAAVVAKALDVPVLAQVPSALARIDSNDMVVLDAVSGYAIVRPSEDILEFYAARADARTKQKAAYAANRDLPAVTQDGVPVSLMINAGFLIDIQSLQETGAAGVGLFRTEMPFLALPKLPGVKEQETIYGQILDAAGASPVVFRTLDVGGDKLTSYWNGAEEDNPAMGWRSIRMTLDRPSLFRQQLRALIAAGADRDLRVMFPMVASVAEFNAARALLNMEVERAWKRTGHVPLSIKVGTMIEVPSLLWQMPALFRAVDFASVGSNDLMQFAFAADRGNPRLSDRYDVLSVPMLRMLRSIVSAAQTSNCAISLCGEMAGRPLEALALLASGYRTLSMSAAAVGPVKAMITSVNLRAVGEFLETIIEADSVGVRARLSAYARDHGIVVN